MSRLPQTPAPDARLEEFIHAHRRLFVLTGAGISTDSGIPTTAIAAGNGSARRR